MACQRSKSLVECVPLGDTAKVEAHVGAQQAHSRATGVDFVVVVSNGLLGRSELFRVWEAVGTARLAPQASHWADRHIEGAAGLLRKRSAELQDPP